MLDARGVSIRPEDIPDEVRGVGVSLLPVSIPRGGSVSAPRGAVANIRPELEFVFRTLVELRVDMDDLRREFEAYRGRYDGSWRSRRTPRFG